MQNTNYLILAAIWLGFALFFLYFNMYCSPGKAKVVTFALLWVNLIATIFFLIKFTLVNL